ncbi:RHS repeat domain-containing protein [Alistipes montrealensis]|uniref:RHS repeat domain-containing protein n=1 Tax=Alistipes montrealensis TaxID=2834113 RepID=UPI002017E635|nr:RHS repeat-associated core domain-containing protein [Alistipes montrealensis]
MGRLFCPLLFNPWNYSYLSDGTKLSATDADGNGLYYLGSLVYGSRNGDLSLESAAFNGGRFIVTSNGIESHYFVTDHLGSVRAVVNNDGEVIERNDYYPFGLRWNAGELSDNRYRYNGKETQSFVDVPYTDYGARMLDSKYRVNWFNIDQLLEKHHSLSPYLYCGGNPISRIDILGLDFWTTTDPRLINQFLQQLIESGSFSPDGWTHFTDDEFLNDDPESNSYLWRSDSGNSFFVWKTSDVNGVYVNSYKLPDIPTSFDLYASLNNKDLDIASNLIAGVGITAGVGEQLLFSSKLETWMGRDLKIRSQNWGGNQYTGGKIKFASKYAKYFKWAGFAATAASAYNIELMYRKGQICKEQYYIEQASNAVSMVPFYGTAWAFGWDMGKVCASWLK